MESCPKEVCGNGEDTNRGHYKSILGEAAGEKKKGGKERKKRERDEGNGACKVKKGTRLMLDKLA